MSQNLQPLNPKPFLTKLCGEKVSIKLKWNFEYKGELKAFDNYMNVTLVNAEEWVKDVFRGNLGEVLIRCNNILYIRKEDDDENVKKMEEDA
eukprot:GHVO01006290.1.p1 GENE.GHVO01006290.1~~GHVO01006290.1.p1  ORF type:complete len:107 (+),score=24.53 GHVO01006290.1:46-321(+)